MSAINERVSDATIDGILSGVIEGVEPTTQEVLMARELKELRGELLIAHRTIMNQLAQLQQYRAAAACPAVWVRYGDANHAPDCTLDNDEAREWVARGLDVVRMVSPINAAPQVTSVPEEWRSSMRELVKAMRDYEMDVDEPAPYKHRKMIRRAELLLAAPAVQAEQTKLLIGWRTTDYTEETSDPEMAKNWAAVVGVLPVFEGDINTRLQAEQLSVDTLANVLRNAPVAPCDSQGKKRDKSPAIPDGWIPVSERMPDETQPVIVVADGGVVQRTIYQFCDGVWIDWYEQYDEVPHDAFTHWMPLPAAPKQEAE